MIATLLHTYTDAAITKRHGMDAAPAHIVYFDYCWGFDPIREWLCENIPGKHFAHYRYIVFEDYDDALLCYLRYKG